MKQFTQLTHRVALGILRGGWRSVNGEVCVCVWRLTVYNICINDVKIFAFLCSSRSLSIWSLNSRVCGSHGFFSNPSLSASDLFGCDHSFFSKRFPSPLSLFGDFHGFFSKWGRSAVALLNFHSFFSNPFPTPLSLVALDPSLVARFPFPSASLKNRCKEEEISRIFWGKQAGEETRRHERVLGARRWEKFTLCISGSFASKKMVTYRKRNGDRVNKSKTSIHENEWRNWEARRRHSCWSDSRITICNRRSSWAVLWPIFVQCWCPSSDPWISQKRGQGPKEKGKKALWQGLKHPSFKSCSNAVVTLLSPQQLHQSSIFHKT